MNVIYEDSDGVSQVIPITDSCSIYATCIDDSIVVGVRDGGGGESHPIVVSNRGQIGAIKSSRLMGAIKNSIYKNEDFDVSEYLLTHKYDYCGTW